MSTITKFFVINSVILASILGLFSLTAQTASAANCTPNASKQCISNIVYWYDSCGAVQSIAQNCNTTNQMCQNAQCVNKPSTTTQNPTSTTQSGTSHFTKSCYQGNLYWYSSQGNLQDLAQNCADANSCTTDNCASSNCLNQLKCDGLTCAVGSPDYITYCQGAQTSTNTNTNTTTTTGTNSQLPITNSQPTGLAISLFIAKDVPNLVWQKTLNITANEKLVFLEIIKNAAITPTDNVSVTTDITGNLTYTGNLQIDGISSAGNISSGLPLGTIPAKTSKMISFSATTNAQANQSIFQATAVINANSTPQDSDYIVLNTAAAATTTTTSTNIQNLTPNTQNTGLWANLVKNWWLWLIILIILVVVFIIIFRKLSSNV